MFKLFLLLFGLTGLVVLSSCCKSKHKSRPAVAVGQLAPDFSLQDDTGQLVKLSGLRGKNVVLYFYPKDFTPGCTQEACSLQDIAQVYREHNIVILGVSYDGVKSHRQFKLKHGLRFALLSDLDRQVAKLYGANTGVKNYLFPSRMTFLINTQGLIIKIFNQVEVTGHAQEILKYFS